SRVTLLAHGAADDEVEAAVARNEARRARIEVVQADVDRVAAHLRIGDGPEPYLIASRDTAEPDGRRRRALSQVCASEDYLIGARAEVARGGRGPRRERPVRGNVRNQLERRGARHPLRALR